MTNRRRVFAKRFDADYNGGACGFQPHGGPIEANNPSDEGK
jgi:hypothetical protein